MQIGLTADAIQGNPVSRLVTALFRRVATGDPVVLSSLACVFAAVFGAAIASQRQGVPIAIGAIYLFLCLALILIDRTTGPLLSFFVADSALHLVKRLIFIQDEPVPQSIYYAIQLVPTAMLILALVARWPTIARRVRLSGALLAAYVALATINTAVTVPAFGITVVLSAFHQTLLPFFVFFLGLSVTSADAAKVSRLFVALAAASIVHGMWQLFFGLTYFEVLWAEHAVDSIQARKLANALAGYSDSFRPFAFYPDAFTWGLFLGSACALRSAVLGLGARQVLLSPLFVVCLTGAVISLSRSSLLLLAATLAIGALYQRRILERPLALLAALAVGWFGADLIANYLVRQFFGILSFDVPVLARLFQIGTIGARTSGIAYTTEAILQYPFMGNGLAYASRFWEIVGLDDARLGSHNIVAEIVIQSGLPALVVIIGFLGVRFQELIGGDRTKGGGVTNLGRGWIVAFAVASIVTGFVSGPGVLSQFLFLLLGWGGAGPDRDVPGDEDGRLRRADTQRGVPGYLSAGAR